MRKRIFIHIGTHKTGTTSIQFFLTEQRERLRNCGILVPHAGTGIADAPAGHHNIAYELCNHPSYDAKLAGVAGLIKELRESTEPAAVISSENLQFLHTLPEQLVDLDQTLDSIGYDRTYMVFFRNIEDYFISLYSQLKATGRLPDGNYQLLYEQMKTKGYIVDRIQRYFEFDYARFTRDWQEIIGPNLTTFDFDDVTKTSELLPVFLESIGASRDIVNVSYRFPRFNVTMIGRNELCPCQSGKRYKHCHGLRS